MMLRPAATVAVIGLACTSSWPSENICRSSACIASSTRFYKIRGLIIPVPPTWTITPAFYGDGPTYMILRPTVGSFQVELGPVYPLPSEKAKQVAYMESLARPGKTRVRNSATFFGRLLFMVDHKTNLLTGLGRTSRSAFGVCVKGLDADLHGTKTPVTTILSGIEDARRELPEPSIVVTLCGLKVAVPACFDAFLDDRKPGHLHLQLYDDATQTKIVFGDITILPTGKTALDSTIRRLSADLAERVKLRRSVAGPLSFSWNPESTDFFRTAFSDHQRHEIVVEGFLVQGSRCIFFSAVRSGTKPTLSSFLRTADRSLASLGTGETLATPLSSTPWIRRFKNHCEIQAYLSLVTSPLRAL